ncbi:hypothetical protein [Emticicia sp. W12TSBA100-4]|uniref:hypothetical protein n=1 Tax=Emticicia sp. W12TSBA100-4 TaxID=3160965 RepID=UPI003306107E
MKKDLTVMILGTYWYFNFPTDLYKFDFFKFKKGYGGHADNPAELIAFFEAENPKKIIEDLQKLIDKHSDSFLFIYQEENKLKIGTGGYQLFDYDFLLIQEVEKLLKNHRVWQTKEQVFTKSKFTQLYNIDFTNKNIYPNKGFLQVVGSGLKKYNAENSKLRLDCTLQLVRKNDFIKDLKKVATEENLDILYYYDKDFKDKTNLMLFFTNGRQGFNLTKKKYIDILSFENKIEKVILTHNANYGHVSGWDLYPQRGPQIEMIIEEEYIL